MTQTIKIEVPEGKKAIYDKTTQIVKFVNIKPVRSKSWEEFCKNHDGEKGYYIDTNSDISTYPIVKEWSNGSKDLLSTKEDAEGILALIQLTRLRDEWVGDWKPKRDSTFELSKYSDENKWNIVVIDNAVVIVSNTVENHLLSFPTYKLAYEFLHCFRELLETAIRFI